MPPTKKTSFQDDWLSNPKYEMHIRRATDSNYKASCILCHSSFSLSNMGKTALDSHISSKKHQKAVQVKNSSYNIRSFGAVELSTPSNNYQQQVL